MLSLLTKAIPLVKGAGRLVGALKAHDDGRPVAGRKARLVAAVVALAAAYGYVNPEHVDALVEVALALLDFAG